MTFDVAARLTEGDPAVTNTQTYVQACHALGYQNADLTARGAQVHQWYATEDGLDLSALDADCAALQAAAGAAEEALRIEREGGAALATAWHGDSGGAAADFVDRHCSAGAAVAAALRSAAQGCTALRDNLWYLVDGKVAAAVTIDDRHAGERAAWLAAAQTVTTGTADRTAAAEIVKRQIVPYVDGDIRTDWVGAMRSATASVSAAYDDAAHALNAHAAARFEVPAQLGPPIPAAPPPETRQASVDPPPAITAPAAAPVSPVAPPPMAATPAAPSPALDMPASQPLPQPTTADTAAPAAAPPLTGGLPPGGTTVPDVGGGLSGLVGQIADALGGLFDAPTDAPAADPPGIAEPDPIDPPEAEPADAGGEDPPPDATDEPPVDEPEAVASQPDPPEPEPDTGAPPQNGPEPVAAEPVTAPAPAVAPPDQPEAPADAQTPCEIAADELPQVGQ